MSAAEIAWGVLVRQGDDAAFKRVFLLCAATVYVGRNPQRHAPFDADADLVTIKDPERRISSVHCVLRSDADGVTLESRASNGLRVGGAPFAAGMIARLSSGDAITVVPARSSRPINLNYRFYAAADADADVCRALEERRASREGAVAALLRDNLALARVIPRDEALNKARLRALGDRNDLEKARRGSGARRAALALADARLALALAARRAEAGAAAKTAADLAYAASLAAASRLRDALEAVTRRGAKRARDDADDDAGGDVPVDAPSLRAAPDDAGDADAGGDWAGAPAFRGAPDYAEDADDASAAAPDYAASDEADASDAGDAAAWAEFRRRASQERRDHALARVLADAAPTPPDRRRAPDPPPPREAPPPPPARAAEPPPPPPPSAARAFARLAGDAAGLRAFLAKGLAAQGNRPAARRARLALLAVAPPRYAAAYWP